MKVTVYVGNRKEDGKLEDVRKWEDIPPDERMDISRKLQVQCAQSIGYILKE